MDPQRMPSSVGGFPWKANGNYNTIVYIKNETNVVRKYTASLVYENGGYAYGIHDIKPGQTIAIDFKKIRDEQTPDAGGNVILLNLEKGQIAWSAKGQDNNIMSGRSEQVNETLGIASTYACYNCCSDTFEDGWVTPFNEVIWQGHYVGFIALQQDKNCYQQMLPPYLVPFANWLSYDSNVATVNPFGDAQGMSTGTPLSRQAGTRTNGKAPAACVSLLRDLLTRVLQL